MAEIDCNTKQCAKCKCVKSLDEFGVRSIRSGKPKSRCRECVREDNRSWYVSRDVEHTRRVRKAWRDTNQDKKRAYVRAHQARNPEKTKANFNRWRQNNQSTMRIWARLCAAKRKGASGTFTKSDIEEINRWQKGRCAYCRKKLGDQFSIDHIQPIARGGSNDRRNLQLTCKPCNSKKHSKDPIVFAQLLGRLL